MPAISALKYAVKLLGYRARTERELRERLIAQRYEQTDIEHTLERLKRAKLIDDEAFAASYAHDKLSIHRRGPRRIYFELIKRGVDKKIAQQATQALDGDDELAMAKSLLTSKARAWTNLDPLTQKRRAIGLLSRRGFSSAVVIAATKKLGSPIGDP